MNRSVTRKLTIIFICLILVSSCSGLQKDKINYISSIYAKKHFCQLFLSTILASDRAIYYCFLYPVSAFSGSKAWFWINPNQLQHYIDSTNKKVPKVEIETQTELPKEDEFIIDPTKPVVYLTFDDGPGKHTDRVLDILKEEEVLATFFVLGIQVERNPLFTKRIVEEGHAIGNHTYNHDYNVIYKDFDSFAQQVIETNRVIYELTGEKVTLFRAPGGSINNLDEGYFTALYEAEFTVFDWNIDSKDSVVKGIKSEDIIKNITSHDLVNPAHVLLHDTTNHEQSMLALRDIIHYYKDAGYQFAPISDNTTPLTFNLGKKMKWSRAKVTKQQIMSFTQSINELYEDDSN